MKIKGNISVRSLLRIIRRGFEMLSHIEWVSAYGSHLSMAGVLGAVGLLFALRDGRLGHLSNLLMVSDRDISSEKLRVVPGLRNLGNNCFLNVVLQSLASCSSFRRYLIEVKEVQLTSNGEEVEDMPLLIPLADLLEDLSALRGRSKSINPRKVMSAMEDYIPKFQLTNQQGFFPSFRYRTMCLIADCEEALLHLISCLREELADSFTPNYGSLVNIDAPTSRILALKKIDTRNELRRGQRHYFGPFDCVLSNFLTCRSCSSEILMDSGCFHSLHLSLMSTTRSSVLNRCRLEDCIESFLSPEVLKDYFCSHCWHMAGIKYLTLIGGKQEDIHKLKCCAEQDGCDCKKLSSLQTLPWSNRFSRVFKQLYIAHFPQILCLYLKRTSTDAFGEPMKIQGHISFPLILDLSAFVKHGFGLQKQNVDTTKTPTKPLYPSSISNSHVNEMCCNPMTTMKVQDEAPQISPQHCSLQIATCANNIDIHSETDKAASDAVPSKTQLYRLVSVVEHFGIAGSGHYTEYRGVKSQIEEDDVDGGTSLLPLQWFRISDTDVHHALEEDVLDAEASLLFYERI